MRIVHWYPSFLRGGGVANAVVRLANAQALLGLEPVIVAAEAPSAALYGAPEIGAGVELVEWRPAWSMGRGGIVLHGVPSQAARRLRAQAPDVLHVHGEFNPDNWWAPRLWDAPLLLSPHGAFHPPVARSRWVSGKSVYVCLARRLLYRHVGALHAVSPLEREHLTAAFPGVDIDCVPHGPSIGVGGCRARADPSPRGRRSPVRFVFVGRLDVVAKGLDLLLAAYAAALPQLPERGVTLTLIGPDWNGGRAMLEQRARTLDIAERISLTGAVPGAEVERLLCDCDGYVQLSRHEAFGFGVADALIAGKPVITTTTTGVASFPELARLPQLRVVRPKVEEAVRAMVEVTRRIEELGAAAEATRHEVQRFLSWERVAAAHRKTYERLRSAA